VLFAEGFARSRLKIGSVGARDEAYFAGWLCGVAWTNNSAIWPGRLSLPKNDLGVSLAQGAMMIYLAKPNPQKGRLFQPGNGTVGRQPLRGVRDPVAGAVAFFMNP